MVRISFLRRRRRSRKYPIKRDEHGRSARQRAFEAFDHGKRPGEVAEMAGISPRTAYRYRADWKELPQNLELGYRMMKTARESKADFSHGVAKSLSAHLGMSQEEVKERLERPWGLKQLLMGKWPDYRRDREQSEAESRLCAALVLISLVESRGVPPERILEHLSKLRTSVG